MKPVQFKEVNVVVVKGQPEYQELPAQYNNDVPEAPFTSCWQLDEAEIAQIAKTGRLYLKQLTFGKAFQPIHPTIYNPFKAIEMPYYETDLGTLIAMVPLQDNTHDPVNALNMPALIESIRSKYVELQTENMCFIKIDMPKSEKSGGIIGLV